MWNVIVGSHVFGSITDQGWATSQDQTAQAPGFATGHQRLEYHALMPARWPKVEPFRPLPRPVSI